MLSFHSNSPDLFIIFCQQLNSPIRLITLALAVVTAIEIEIEIEIVTVDFVMTASVMFFIVIAVIVAVFVIDLSVFILSGLNYSWFMLPSSLSHFALTMLAFSLSDHKIFNLQAFQGVFEHHFPRTGRYNFLHPDVLPDCVRTGRPIALNFDLVLVFTTIFILYSFSHSLMAAQEYL